MVQIRSCHFVGLNERKITSYDCFLGVEFFVNLMLLIGESHIKI